VARCSASAWLVAHGVHETGRREIIGLDVGAAETEAFWTDFLRALVARGLIGVQRRPRWQVDRPRHVRWLATCVPRSWRSPPFAAWTNSGLYPRAGTQSRLRAQRGSCPSPS
jgi:hypothetical protein